MKKALVICLMVIFIVNTASYGYCGPLRKLGRGISNILTCPLELPYRYGKAVGKKEGGAERHLMYGLFEGIGMMGMRLIIGAYETATFLFPMPEGYEPMLNDPEFLWQGPSKEVSPKKT